MATSRPEFHIPETQEPKTSLVPDSEILCYAVRKCGEFFAGPQDFCCWSSSLRPTRRWRWPVLRSREPCTACATRSPSIHGSPCHAIIRWQSQWRPSPNRPKSDSEALFQANDDNCCQNHCCCCAATSEWARPAFNLLGFLSPLIGPASPSQSATLQSIDISGHDSARAPPRS